MKKVYLVMSGEYAEDRVVSAVFKSKKLAEHYANEQEKINQYEPYWVVDYELSDSKFSFDMVANKYYYACVECKKDEDGIKYEVETDEIWDDFLDTFLVEGDDRYDPAVYGEAIKSIGRDVEQEEKDHALSIEYMFGNGIIVDEYDYPYGKYPSKNIYVYSQKGYHDARKLAIAHALKYIETERKM